MNSQFYGGASFTGERRESEEEYPPSEEKPPAQEFRLAGSTATPSGVALAFSGSPGDPNMNTLMEIAPPDFAVEITLTYATAQNFTGKPVYRAPRCYLHADAARALQKAVALAAPLGLGFLIYDAFRPREAQETLWEHTPDPTFLADPARGSSHSRGVAVDLTLVDAATRQPLDMGTAFDAFTPLSAHGCTRIAAESQRNRLLLLGLMTAAGWDFYADEWWHYQLFNARAEYPLLSDAEMKTGML